MPDQTARLLTTLLSKEGGLVTREEIRQSLWPEGEFVDYDHSINKAISQLRSILRDNRASPRFLETVPKRGYRFLGSVPNPPENEVEVDSKEAKPAGDLQVEPASVAAPSLQERPVQALELANHAEALPVPNAHRAVRLTPGWLLSGLAILVIVLAGVLSLVSGLPAMKGGVKPARLVQLGVVPFESTGDGAQQLAESLRVDLTDAISQLPEVQVLAAHSLENKEVGDESIRTIARNLQLDALIYGHLTLTDDRFALQLELIRGSDATHLASFRYEGTRKELPSIGERVQRDIFTHLGLTRQGGDRSAGRTSDPRAYEAYLLARSLLAQRTDESLRSAYAQFHAASLLDPRFAYAYAGMAHAEMILAEHDAIPVNEGFIKTRDLARQALALVPYMSEAHALLGYSAFRLDWDLATAERELRQAIDLDGSQSVYHVWLSVLLCDEGRFDESFQQIDEAHALEPQWAPILLTETFLGAGSRRYDRMLKAANDLVALMPDWALSHGQLAWALWFANRTEDAVKEWREMAILEKDAARQEFEEKGLELLRRQGRTAYARMRLEASLRGFKSVHSNDFVPAEWYAYAGQQDSSLALLEQVVARHQQDALELGVNPAFFEMHPDKRFRNLLTRVGLPSPALPAAFPESQHEVGPALKAVKNLP